MDDFFISYNGADREWAEWIGWVLEEAGLSVVVQAWDFRAGENFPLEMQKALTNTERTLIVLSENFLRADFTQPEWAATFARDPKGVNRSLIPVRVGECTPAGLLATLIYIDLVGLSEDAARKALLDGMRERGKPVMAPAFPGRGATRAIAADVHAKPRFPGTAPPRRPATVSLSHLPNAGEFLEGRTAEMAQLDDAWNNPGMRVLTIVARGGEGKTNLVRHWLNRMNADGWRGAQKIFGWSFFSQGTNEKTASADQFFDQALRFFGEDHPEDIKLPHERGDRLAQLAGAGRNLLVLDGLEPLQYPPGPITGRLKDAGLSTLLSGLAAQSDGLCIVTTRVALPELAAGKTNVSPEIELPALTPEAGAKLLSRLGVKGPQQERESVASRLSGHAYSIQLMGTYLAEVFNGDITRAGEVALLDQDRASDGHAREILESYEKWLSGGTLDEGDKKREVVKAHGEQMLAVLRLLGLFDRPAEMKLFDALRAEPAITGLTEPLVGLSQADWQRTLSRLRQIKLLNPEVAGTIDCHPLLREHFGEQLKERYPDGAKEAHRRIYERLKTSTVDRPDTLVEMIPLFQAVAHGCKAGMADKALNEVLYPRIQREGVFYASNILGANSLTLAAYAMFFARPWRELLPGLTPADERFVFGEAAYLLYPLGRVIEADEPGEAARRLAVDAEDWQNASIYTDNLTDNAVARADAATAIARGIRAVEYSDRSESGPRRRNTRAALGAALHGAGALAAARAAFEDAETIIETELSLHSLRGFAGFRRCSLVLDVLVSETNQLAPDFQELRKRNLQTLAVATANPNEWLLTIGMEHLSLGRISAAEAECNIADPSALTLAQTHLEQAVKTLREAAILPCLGEALIGRADGWRIAARAGDKKAADCAERDLNEAEQIARTGNITQLLIEIAVQRARLALVTNDPARAREHLAEAKRLIKQTDKPYDPPGQTWDEWQPPDYIHTFRKGDIVGYHRADRHIAELEKQLQ